MSKCCRLLSSFAVAFTIAAGAVAAQESKSLPAPGWIKDYDEARARARQTGKPMFVVIR